MEIAGSNLTNRNPYIIHYHPLPNRHCSVILMNANNHFSSVWISRQSENFGSPTVFSKYKERDGVALDFQETGKIGIKFQLKAKLTACLMIVFVAFIPELTAQGVKTDEIVIHEKVSDLDDVVMTTVSYYRNTRKVMVVQTREIPGRGQLGLVTLNNESTSAVIQLDAGKLCNKVFVETGTQPLHFLDQDGDGKWEAVQMFNADFSLFEAYRKTPNGLIAPFSVSEFAKEKVAMQDETLFRAESLAQKTNGPSVKSTPYTRDGKVVMVVQEGPFAQQGIDAIIFLQHDGIIRASIPVRRGKMNGMLVQPGYCAVSFEESEGDGGFGQIKILDDDMKCLEAFRPDGKGRIVPLSTRELNDLNAAGEANIKALINKSRASEANHEVEKIARPESR